MPHCLFYRMALTRLLKQSSEAGRVRRVILPSANGLRSGYVICYSTDEAGRIVEARCLPVRTWSLEDSVAVAFEKILHEVRRADLQLEAASGKSAPLRLVRST